MSKLLLFKGYDKCLLNHVMFKNEWLAEKVLRFQTHKWVSYFFYKNVLQCMEIVTSTPTYTHHFDI